MANEMANDLMMASDNGDIENVERLIDSGVNINFKDNYGDTALMWASIEGHTDIVNLLERSMTTIRIQKRFRGKRTRRKIRTQKAKQRSSLAKLQDSIQGMTGEDLDPYIYKILLELISNMAYNPEVSRRMLEEEQDEQDDPYTEWLQDRSQYGSGQRSKRRRRNKSRRK